MDLNQSLTFDDGLKAINIGSTTYLIASRIVGDTSSFRKKPSPTHPAMTDMLPICNQAIVDAGASGIFDGILLLAMAWQESKNNPRANQGGGRAVKPYRGLMQFGYETGTNPPARPIYDFYNPVDSIYAAARYLKYCWQQYASVSDPKKRLAYAVMGYNAGPGTSVATLEARSLRNYSGGKATGTDPKGYAMQVNTAYKAYAGLPALSEGPLKFT